MDLKLLFDPVPDHFIDSVAGSNTFCHSIYHFGHSDVKVKDMDIALIGIEEFRGMPSDVQPLFEGASQNIREKLYRLKRGDDECRIIDLGTLRNGIKYEDTIDRLREVCAFLLELDVLPLLFGGSHDLDYAMYQGYQSLDKLVSFVNVDAYLDIREEVSESGTHIEKILLHSPNYLFNYSHLGYQSYLIDEKSLNTLEKLYFEAFRIGVIRSNLSDMEPIVREGDLFSFDVGAMKSADAPGCRRPQPFGLTGEEACQLSWYAGLNEKMSSAGYFEYCPGNDDSHFRTAAIVATNLWYFIEGFAHRRGNVQHFSENDYLKYVVSMPTHPETITFYKSRSTEKWWMEVPIPEESSKYTRSFKVPCRYEDYKTATSGEVPDKYVTTHARLL